MSSHVEKTRSGDYVLIDNKTGKVVAGPFAFRHTAEAEIRKREDARKAAEGKRHFTSI